VISQPQSQSGYSDLASAQRIGTRAINLDHFIVRDDRESFERKVQSGEIYWKKQFRIMASEDS